MAARTARMMRRPDLRRVEDRRRPGPGGALTVLTTLTAVALLLAAVVGAAQAPGPRRIVSLVPSLTEALFAIGAGPEVVGVGSFDSYPPQIRTLPRVGALIDPDVERILALRPDLVVTYGSQSTLEAQLARAGIHTYSYRHGGIREVLDGFRDLGRASGHAREADALAAGMVRQLAALRDRVRGRPRPRTLLVIGRQPGTLREVYASGGIGFLHDMLDAAGGDNVFADAKTESVQPSTETLLARAPQVILEIRADGMTAGATARDRDAWSALASVPAVRTGRIVVLTGNHLVVPGPRLVQGAEDFARALHPDVFDPRGSARTPR